MLIVEFSSNDVERQDNLLRDIEELLLDDYGFDEDMPSLPDILVSLINDRRNEVVTMYFD